MKIFEKNDNVIPENIYHYTSFEKFKCILQNGTLRFKLSTQSNDLLDTNYIFKLIKEIQFIKDQTENEKEKLREFMLGYFQHYNFKRNYNSYVTCFTEKYDSRLLWDAYTINRPSNEECELGKNKYCATNISSYNGVAIAFNSDKLFLLIKNAEIDGYCEAGILSPIYYTKKEQFFLLQKLFESSWHIYQTIKEDPDQNQTVISPIDSKINIEFIESFRSEMKISFNLSKAIVHSMIDFIRSYERYAPFLKHQFWEEESEYRASLCRHVNMNDEQGFIQGQDESKYIDLQIQSDTIDYIILGPSFSEKDKDELDNINNSKIKFESFEKKESQGTGIIQMK